ncbi:hypothetical protein OSTOST_08847 [Ostertagia ostertagi]
MTALNMSGNAHMARCVRSTVMRTHKTTDPVQHEVTMIPRQGTFPQSSTPAVSVIANKAVTTPAIHRVRAQSTSDYYVQHSGAPMQPKPVHGRKNMRFFLILMALFVVHLVIVFLLGICLGMLIASVHQGRGFCGCRRRAGKRKDRVDSISSHRNDHVNDPFHMDVEPKKKRVFTAVEMEPPFKTVEKWTQSCDDDPPPKQQPVPPPLPPPPPPAAPPAQVKKVSSPSQPPTKSDFDLWDTPLVPTQRLSPKPSPNPAPVPNPPPKTENRRQIRSVFVDEGVMHGYGGKPMEQRSRPKGNFSYNLA